MQAKASRSLRDHLIEKAFSKVPSSAHEEVVYIDLYTHTGVCGSNSQSTITKYNVDGNVVLRAFPLLSMQEVLHHVGLSTPAYRTSQGIGAQDFLHPR